MNSSSQSRKQRRLYEKYLKSNHTEQYKEWKKDSHKRGEEYHKQYVDSTVKGIESQLESLQTRMIQSMMASGKTNSEIDEYMEDWLNSTKMWSESQSIENFTDLRKKRNQK
jgi:3-oxoacyl-ACP reductase-like protein